MFGCVWLWFLLPANLPCPYRCTALILIQPYACPTAGETDLTNVGIFNIGCCTLGVNTIIMTKHDWAHTSYLSTVETKPKDASCGRGKPRQNSIWFGLRERLLESSYEFYLFASGKSIFTFRNCLLVITSESTDQSTIQAHNKEITKYELLMLYTAKQYSASRVCSVERGLKKFHLREQNKS